MFRSLIISRNFLEVIKEKERIIEKKKKLKTYNHIYLFLPLLSSIMITSYKF